jgi:Protein of unknown function (DUF1501)
MHRYTRRKLLRSLGSIAVLSAPPFIRHAGAQSTPAWGELPAGVWPSGAPAPQYKILEVFLYGGLSPWENFYFRDLSGNRGYRGFQTTGSTLDSYSNLNFNSACAGAPSSSDVPQLLDDSDAAHRVLLAPVTKPLWDPRFLDRMRVVVLQHDLTPHEAAIPYALTGFKLGNPKMAGLGAVIQRRAIAQEELKPVAMRRSIPFSYVLQPTNFVQADNVLALIATGAHPGSSRPVVVSTDSVGLLPQLLRPNASTEGDVAFNYYRSQYEDWMRAGGIGDPARSRSFADYQAAANSLMIAPNLHTLLQVPPLVTPPAAPQCAQLGTGTFPTGINATNTGLRIAAELLRHPTTPARYVGVVDSGIVRPGGAAYDGHGGTMVLSHSLNLLNVLSTLRDLLDTGVLNLADTMIVLTTEFGRSPFRSAGGAFSASSNGRDHWPRGFANVLIGGPVAVGGPIAMRRYGVCGRIQDGGGDTDDGINGVAEPSNVFNCSDMRAAVMLAAGIFPFADGLYGTTDITSRLHGASGHDETARNIRQTLLNVPG